MASPSIEHSHEFGRQYDKLVRQHSGVMDAVAGVEWALSKDATQYPKVPGHEGFYLCLTRDGKDAPSLRLLARVSTKTIELVAIEEQPPE